MHGRAAPATRCINALAARGQVAVPLQVGVCISSGLAGAPCMGEPPRPPGASTRWRHGGRWRCRCRWACVLAVA